VSRERTLEKIMEAFADAVAAGDYAKAEGWLAVARFSQDRCSGVEALGSLADA
jgi:iron uptake system EfeUOB component EfeO/EfeM